MSDHIPVNFVTIWMGDRARNSAYQFMSARSEFIAIQSVWSLKKIIFQVLPHTQRYQFVDLL